MRVVRKAVAVAQPGDYKVICWGSRGYFHALVGDPAHLKYHKHPITSEQLYGIADRFYQAARETAKYEYDRDTAPKKNDESERE